MAKIKRDTEEEIKIAKRQEAVELVKLRYNNARAVSVNDFERFARYYKLFRNRQTQKNYTGLASLFIPEPYRVIRKKTAKLANAIKGIEVTPQTENDREPAKTGNVVMNFLRRKLNLFLLERSAIQESRITGLSWVKVTWDLGKESEQQPYKGFDFSLIPADRVLLAPGTTILDVFEGNIKWLVHEYEADIEVLKKNGNYDKSALKILEERQGSNMKDTSLSQARFMNETSNKQATDKKRKKFKVLEYWGKFVEDKEEQDFLIVIADDAAILRFEENPYKTLLDNPIPFVPFVANPVGNELYPVGDLEPAEHLFNELNDTRNQRMDTVTLNIDPAKEIVRGAQIDEKELVARRGWLIHSNIPGGVRFIPPDMQGVVASVNEEKNIRGDIQQVTNTLDFGNQGDVQAGLDIDTARGAIVAKGEADTITADDVEILKVSLRMLYRIVLTYAQNFLDREFTVRLLDEGTEQFHNVSRESLQGNLDLDVQMETLQDSTTRQQLTLLLLNQAKTIPGAKIGKFFVDTLETFKDNINISEYYEEPGPPAPPPPSVNISLRGELNPLQIGDVALQAGVQESSNDPILNKDLRELMRGNMPEDVERQDKEMEVLQKQTDLMNALDGKGREKELSD